MIDWLAEEYASDPAKIEEEYYRNAQPSETAMGEEHIGFTCAMITWLVVTLLVMLSFS